MGSSIHRQNLFRLRDAVATVAGILLFALFIHHRGIARHLAPAGLLFAAIWLGYSIRQIPLLQVFGLSCRNRKMFPWILPAILLGLLFGFLTRHKFGLSPLPASLGTMALLAPCIGALEELIFRGYIQGHLQPLGRIFALMFSSFAHTGYKLLVILTLSGPLQFDPLFLGIWTFIGGTAFGVLRDLSGSAIPPVTAHMIFDILLYGGLSVAPAWVWS